MPAWLSIWFSCPALPAPFVADPQVRVHLLITVLKMLERRMVECGSIVNASCHRFAERHRESARLGQTLRVEHTSSRPVRSSVVNCSHAVRLWAMLTSAWCAAVTRRHGRTCKGSIFHSDFRAANFLTPFWNSSSVSAQKSQFGISREKGSSDRG